MSDDPKTKPAEPPAIDLQGSDKVPAVWAPRFQVVVNDGMARVTFGEITSDGVAWRTAVVMPWPVLLEITDLLETLKKQLLEQTKCQPLKAMH